MQYPSTIEADVQKIHEQFKAGIIKQGDIVDNKILAALQNNNNLVEWLYELIQLNDKYHKIEFDPQYYPLGECPNPELILILEGLKLRVCCYLEKRKILVNLVSSGKTSFVLTSVEESSI